MNIVARVLRRRRREAINGRVRRVVVKSSTISSAIPGLHVEGNGDTLRLYWPEQALEPEDLSAFFKTLEALAQLFGGKLH